MTDSNTQLTHVQAAISELKGVKPGIFLNYGPTALVFYDYLLTVAAEEKHIWRQKRTLIFHLFLALRYSVLLNFVFACFFDFLPFTTAKGCTIVYRIDDALDLINKASISCIMVLRVYAIWHRNIYVLLPLAGLTMTRVITALINDIAVSITLAQNTAQPHSACTESQNPVVNTYKANMVNSSCTIALDSLIFVLTVTKTVQQVIHCRKLGMHQSLTFCVLRDGLLYFLAVETLVVAQLILDNVPSDPSLINFFGNFQLAASAVLLQHFILNLRQINEYDTPTCLSTGPGELSFARGPVIGNIGAPLRLALEDGITPSGEGHA